MKKRNLLILKRTLSLCCASSLILSQIAPIAYGKENSSKTVVNSNKKNTKVEETPKEININVISNHRSMGFLDAGKIINGNNSLNSDYRPTFSKERILDLFPEYKFADIKEYEYFYDDNNELERSEVSVNNKDDVPNGYGSKLKYLIDNNILNRTTDYIYDKSGVYMSDDRTQHRDGNINSDNKSTSVSGETRYYSPSTRVSKTDFISNLMKLEKVNMSRVIGIQAPYNRVNPNLVKEYVETEPLELSPYQTLMGDTGIDGLNNDVIVNHGVFRQLYTFVTNDVVESYLNDAILKGVVSEEEIGGVEGNSFISNRPNNGISVPGSWYEEDVIRQMYNTVQLSGKEMEKDSDYPDNLNNYLDPIKHILNVSTERDGLAYPWGDSYNYNVDECTFGNPYSNQGIEIIKRPSVIEVNNGFFDKNNKDEKGYQYFKTEELTLAQAYVYAYKFVKNSDTDSSVTKQEVDYINSAYGLDFDKLLEEEVEAVKYLIAKGIINPEDNTIRFSATTAINNGDMVELLYRIKNKDTRYTFEPHMTQTDIDMLNKGYSKSNITVRNDGTSANNAKVTYKHGNSDGVSLQEAQLADRIYNTSNYDYVYVRYPKDISNADKVTLITDDKYRLIIEPYNKFLNGGREVKTVTDSQGKEVPEYINSIDPGLGERIYDNDNNYVYVDKDGYTWARYILNKDSNVKLTLKYTDGNIKTYQGIAGEGVYYLVNGDDKSFNKISLDNSKNNKFTTSLYDKVITNDLETRTYLQQSMNKKETNNNLKNMVSKVIKSDRLLSNNIEYREKVTLPQYGAQEVGSVLVGPYNREQLEHLTYHDRLLCNYDGRKWTVNTGTISTSQILNNVTVVPSEVNPSLWYLKYEYTGLAIDKGISAFESELGIRAFAGETKTTMPSYTKATSNNEDVTMVSKDELSELGVKALSDKMLINEKTGQRAFINTDECFTLIGNNITRYTEKTIMATAAGESGSSNRKVFYNLDIIMELINDTTSVIDRAGKNIFVDNITDYTFNPIDIYDNNASYTNSHGITVGDKSLLLDRSYMIYNTTGKLKDYGTYVNLSALTAKASNFIFFRDKNIEGLNMLVVYTPKTELTATDSKTHNGLIESMKKIQESGSNMSPLSPRSNYRTNAKVLSEYLFTAGAGENLESKYIKKSETTENYVKDAADDVLPSMYQYDVYFLVDENLPSEQVRLVYDEFSKKILEVSDGKKLLDDAFVSKQLDPNSKHNEDTKENDDRSNIKFEVARTVNNIANVNHKSKAYFYIEPGSHNLYMRTNQPKNNLGIVTNLSDVYKSFFKNRLYVGMPTKDVKDYKGYFRAQRYYYNTPPDCAPLEQLCLATSTTGNIKQSSGKGMGSLKTVKTFPVCLKKVIRPRDIGGTQGSESYMDFLDGRSFPFGSNILVPYPSMKVNGSLNYTSTDLGMFTNIFSSPTELDQNRILKSEDSLKLLGLAKNQDGKIYKNSTILHLFNVINMTVFQEEYNKTYHGGENKFDLIKTNNTASYSTNALTSCETLAKMYQNTWSGLQCTNKDSKGDEFSATKYWNNSVDDINEYIGFFKNTPFYKMNNGDTFLTIHLGEVPRHLKSSKKIQEIVGSQEYSKDNIYNDNISTDYGCVFLWEKTANDTMKIICGMPLTKQFTRNGRKYNTLDVSAYKGLTSSGNISTKQNVDKGGQLKTALLDKMVECGIINVDRGSKYYKPTYSKLYYVPTASVPAGTVFVNQEGLMVSFSADRIRTEVNYISDIINSLLARLQFEENSMTYLMNVPEGSKVTLGDHTFVKTSKMTSTPLKNSTGGSTNWQSLLMYPSERNVTNEANFDYDQVSDYNMMYYLILSLYDETIPNVIGSAGSKVQLSQIAGNGIWRLPFPDEVSNVLGKNGDKYYNISSLLSKESDGSINVWTYNDTIKDMVEDLKTIGEVNKAKYVIQDSDFTAEGNKIRVEPLLKDYRGDKPRLILDYRKSGDKGYLMPVINLPPTLTVETVTSEPNSYRITGYVNESIYGFDTKNDYVMYLMSRNTPVESPTDVLEMIRSQKYNGDHYKTKLEVVFAENWYYKVMSGLETFFFAICLFLILSILVLLPVVNYSPIMRSIIYNLCYRLDDRDIVSWITAGVVSIRRETTLARVFITCTLLSICANIFFNNVISTFLFSLLHSLNIV